MGEIDSFKGRVSKPLGEIDISGIRERFGWAPLEVWPGERTDIENLERNAAAFRREERRRAFESLFSRLAKVFSRRQNSDTNGC